MFEIAYISVLSIAAFIAPIVAITLILLAVQFNKNRQTGFMHFVPYAILMVAIADTYFSGRSLDNFFLLLHSTEVRSPLNIWLVRFATVFILMASFERIFSVAMKNGHIWGVRPGLTASFVIFWLGSVCIPMFFSAHPYFSHDYFYPLIVGLAVLSMNQQDSRKFILALRNGLILVTLAGFLMIPIHPEMVLESNYSQGFIPGLPRFSGLMPYAIMQAVVALVLILILHMYPLKTKFVTRLVWLLGLAALFLAQSKTSWISAGVSFAVLTFMEYLHSNRSGVNLHKKSTIAIYIVSIVLAISLIGGLTVILGDLGTRIDKFLFSSEGQQLTSFTGRDVIWEFALKEWAQNPILGYGPQFLDLEQRMSIGLLNATHAHNQFIDTMARSGLVGLISLIGYLVAMVFNLKSMTSIDKPLAVAIFIVLLLRAISEVPFSLFGYGVELLFQLGLLSLLVAGQADIEPNKNHK